MSTSILLDALFGAVLRTGGGLDGALELLSDGKLDDGPLSSVEAQVASMCAIMKWHGSDDRLTFEFVLAHVDERAHADPVSLERLHQAYYLYFGIDPLCAWR